MHITTTAPTTPATETPAAPAPPTPAPAPGGVRKVSLAAKKPASGGKKEYPAYPTDEQTVQLVDWLVKHLPVPDQVDAAKKDLGRKVTPWYFEYASGKAAVESTVLVRGTQGVIGVSFANDYRRSVTEEQLSSILGGRIGQFFRQKFEIEIDGDKVPAGIAKPLIGELTRRGRRPGSKRARNLTQRAQRTPSWKAARGPGSPRKPFRVNRARSGCAPGRRHRE